MSQFTPLNVEQSIAKYFSGKFVAEGYSVYWHDTQQTEGTGSTEVTLLREFPPEPGLLIDQSSTRTEGTVKVPTFMITAKLPEPSPEERMGIGESEGAPPALAAQHT